MLRSLSEAAARRPVGSAKSILKERTQPSLRHLSLPSCAQRQPTSLFSDAVAARYRLAYQCGMDKPSYARFGL